MARRAPIIVATLVGLFTLWAFFGDAILGRQFAYRDAAHFYYPLYQKVQSEWDAGRVPLWETEENAGMPLLGNPTAAVLYPGKIIYAVLPYALAARVYIIVHAILCFAGMFIFARSLGISITGAVISALSYAFGAPVLFQYCNIIYLVGAAWVPWGFWAIDAWLRKGQRIAIVGLAVVLAMQVLGGEPQAAYLEGLCAGGYALLLTRKPPKSPDDSGIRLRPRHWLLIGMGIFAWFGVTIFVAHVLGEARPKKIPVPTFTWSPFVPIGVLCLWAMAGFYFFDKWRRRQPGARTLAQQYMGLVVAAGLGGLAASAQLLPVIEFTRLTSRNTEEGSHDIYPFSLEPYRVVEFAWPNVFGTINDGNRSWLGVIPPATGHRIWVPSLYVGGLTLLLALAGMGFKRGPTWRGWLTIIGFVTLLASFGEYLSPLWLGRFFSPIASYVGPHDPYDTNAIRLDGYLRDGDGSFYWFISTFVPGFQQFRYPSKLLTFTVLAVTLLAGFGWDRVSSRDDARRSRAFKILAGLSIAGLCGSLIFAGQIRGIFQRNSFASSFGPLEPGGAWFNIVAAFGQCCVLLAIFALIVRLNSQRPQLAACLMIAIVGVDLAVANARLVMTSNQAEFESKPKVLEIIEAAEKQNPAPGPYRIHRMPIWGPEAWRQENSHERVVDFIRWERDTIQPKYGLPYNVEYTHTQGVAELYDYEWFFSPFTVKLTPALAQKMHLNLEDRPVYFPRRGFDLWNSRYFVLPMITPWTSPERGAAAFLQEIERIYPPTNAWEGPDSEKRQQEFLRNSDFQIVRNPNAFPRAWVVHDVRLAPPIEGLSRMQRKDPMEEMLYNGDSLWEDETRHVLDLKSIAILETSNGAAFARYRSHGPTGFDETVNVKLINPQRVELEVSMNRPGFVILSDVYYPGWTLTIDGQPSEILRVNRMMRGAAVESGKHKLVYEYQPRSFAVGKMASAAGVFGMFVTSTWAFLRRRSPAPFRMIQTA